MMTFLDFYTAIYDDVSSSTSDLFFTLAYVKRRINARMKYVVGYYDWPQTEEALKRDSEVGAEWYNYPENIKQDSIKLLMFNSEFYEKVSYPDYLRFKEKYGVNATDKIFTDFQNKYFISPTPTAIAEIALWGQVIPEDMVDTTDVTPFTNDPDIEQVIYDLAIADCYKKSRGQMFERGRAIELEAMQKLESIKKKVMLRQASYRRKDNPMFNHVNLLRRRGRGHTKIGSFNSL